jgi:hypothetical protein
MNHTKSDAASVGMPNHILSYRHEVFSLTIFQAAGYADIHFLGSPRCQLVTVTIPSPKRDHDLGCFGFFHIGFTPLNLLWVFNVVSKNVNTAHGHDEAP